MKRPYVSRMLSFFYEFRWVAVTIILVCTAWFSNECIIKGNAKEIKRLNSEMKYLDDSIHKLDDVIYKNSSEIDVLNERIMNVSK